MAKTGKKMSLDFEGFDTVIEQMRKLSNEEEIKRVAGLALEASFDYVKKNVEAAVQSSKFNFEHTGETAKSIIQTANVEWNGSVGKVGVGFDITGKETGHNGLASIFLMYGTPRIRPDNKLYNAVYGTATRKKVQEIQSEIFDEEMAKLMS